MGTPTLPIPMDHDGLSTIPSSTQSLVSLSQAENTAENARSTSLPSRRHSLSVNGSGTGMCRRSSNTLGIDRIFCPVVGCPDALSSSNKFFRDFASIKSHIDDHITGYRSGAVPSDFLRHHDYSQCDVCDRVVHKRYRGTHPRCRPRARREEQINNLRNRDNSSNDRQMRQQQSQNSRDLPSLSIIHESYVPTIKNIPRC